MYEGTEARLVMEFCRLRNCTLEILPCALINPHNSVSDLCFISEMIACLLFVVASSSGRLLGRNREWHGRWSDWSRLRSSSRVCNRLYLQVVFRCVRYDAICGEIGGNVVGARGIVRKVF